MPCWTVVVNTVELENVPNHDLLEKGLREKYGKITVQGQRIGTLHGKRRQVSDFIFTVDGARVVLKDGQLTSTLPEARVREIVGDIKIAYNQQAVMLAARQFRVPIKKVSPTVWQLEIR